MKNQEMSFSNILKKAAADMIQRDLKRWPPDCAILSFQPERPQEKPQEKNED